MRRATKCLFFLVVLAVSSCDTSTRQATIDTRDNVQVENRGAGKDRWYDALPRPEWAQYESIPQPEVWFEVYRIREDIFAVYEPGQFEEVISFLIIGSDRALLFDSGLGIGNMRSVIDSLTDQDVIVLNSHTHYDHTGGNYQFEKILGRDTEWTRAREAGSTHEDVAEFLAPGWVWKDLPAGFDAETFRSQPFTISTTISEGYEIDLGDRVLEVLVTPGHAPDALCLIDRENRLLFTGDTFYLAPLYTHLEGSDFWHFRQTATRLAALAEDVDQVMTAHNVPVVDSDYLTQLGDAFDTIVDGRGDYVFTDGNREYDFGDFSVIVRADILQ